MSIFNILTLLFLQTCKCVLSAPIGDLATTAPCTPAGGLSKEAAVAIAVCVTFVICLIIFIIVYCCCKKRFSEKYKTFVPITDSNVTQMETSTSNDYLQENIKMKPIKKMAEIPSFFDNWKHDLMDCDLRTIQYKPRYNKDLGFNVEVKHEKIYVSMVRNNTNVHNLGMLAGDQIVGVTVYFDRQSAKDAEKLISAAASFPMCIYLNSKKKDLSTIEDHHEDLDLRELKVVEAQIEVQVDVQREAWIDPIYQNNDVTRQETERKISVDSVHVQPENEPIISSTNFPQLQKTSEVNDADVESSAKDIENHSNNEQPIIKSSVTPSYQGNIAMPNKTGNDISLNSKHSQSQHLDKEKENFMLQTTHQENDADLKNDAEDDEVLSIIAVPNRKENIDPSNQITNKTGNGFLLNSKNLSNEKWLEENDAYIRDKVESIKGRLLNALPIIDDTSVIDGARLKFSQQIVQRVLKNATNYIIQEVMDHSISKRDETDQLIEALIATASQFDPIEHMIFKAVLRNIEADEISNGGGENHFDTFDAENIDADISSDESQLIPSSENEKVTRASAYPSFNNPQFLHNSQGESANKHRYEMLQATYLDDFESENETSDLSRQSSQISSKSKQTKNIDGVMESEDDLRGESVNLIINNRDYDFLNSDDLKVEEEVEQNIIESTSTKNDTCKDEKGIISTNTDSADRKNLPSPLTLKDSRKRMRFSSPKIAEKVATMFQRNHSSTPQSIVEEEILPEQVGQAQMQLPYLNDNVSAHSLADLDKEIALNNVEIATLVLMDSFERQRLHQELHGMTDVEQQPASPVSEEYIYALNNNLKKKETDNTRDLFQAVQDDATNEYNESTSPLDEDLLHEIYQSAREFHEEDNYSDLFEYQSDAYSETGSLKDMIENVDQLSEERFESLIQRLENDSD